jgi:hypothetical protein
LSSVDPEAAISFYTGLFGWSTRETGTGATVLLSRDLAATGVVRSADGGPSTWLTYFATEDIKDTVDSVVTAGGAVLRPAAEVGDRGRAALVADAEGAVFGLWQRGTFVGTQVVSEPNAVCWIELNTRDTAGAATFYDKVFGWTAKKSELGGAYDYWEWIVHSRAIGGMLPIDQTYPAEIPAHWRTTIEVDDCAATVERGLALGGQVVFGPMDVGVGTYAQFLDPQGATFGVIEVIPELRLAP